MFFASAVLHVGVSGHAKRYAHWAFGWCGQGIQLRRFHDRLPVAQVVQDGEAPGGGGGHLHRLELLHAPAGPPLEAQMRMIPLKQLFLHGRASSGIEQPYLAPVVIRQD